MQTFSPGALSCAREAKTNNAKANILANFGGGDLSPRPAGILMRRPGGSTMAHQHPASSVRHYLTTKERERERGKKKKERECLIEDTRAKRTRRGLKGRQCKRSTRPMLGPRLPSTVLALCFFSFRLTENTSR